KKSNADRYAEGFHLGTYYKFKYQDIYDPTGNTVPEGNVVRFRGNYHFGGGMLGFQWVKKGFVIDQSIGLGLGLGFTNAGLRLAPDFRLGFSVGRVLF